ncbi:MAG: transposase [Symploca sp. SIO2G7]|nr:transposase [Symploca sp. SIO2G7]
MEYRRAKIAGGTYFFTVVTHDRRQFLCEPDNISLLRDAFRCIMQNHPFKIEAIVILPEHLHCIWTLPDEDDNFSTRWRLIKEYFSRRCAPKYCAQISTSRKKKQEKAVWQRRFWEHHIRDEDDFINHVEYIHYNPVKHGLVQSPKNWEYSSFSRYVKAGIYDLNWGTGEKLTFAPSAGCE